MRKTIAGKLMLSLGLVVLLTSPAYTRTQGRLQVTPDSVDFGEVQAYSPETATSEILIANCGENGSALCWQIESNDTWTRIDSSGYQGVIDLPDDPPSFYYTVGACGLCVAYGKENYEDIIGVYQGSFSIAQYFYDENDTEEPCQWESPAIDRVTIMAAMTIAEYNLLEVSPGVIDFGEDVESTTLGITNAGQGTMEWKAVVSADTSWLTINDGTGADGAVSSGGTDTVTVSVDRSLVQGCASEYLGYITVTSENAEPAEKVVNVTMNKKIEPPQPSTPTPGDGVIDQPLYSTLKWEEGEAIEDVGGVVNFDVYFSTNRDLVDSSSPSTLVCEDLTVPYCDPTAGGGELDATTTYYWKVNAKDACDDTVVSGSVWSFTTGSAPAPTCPASVALQLNSREMGTLRSFRDEALANSLAGARYVDLYYSPYAVEALLILLFNPDLRICADGIIKESLPVIQALLRGEKATFAPDILGKMELFLDEFGNAASPELKKIIGVIREHIKTGALLKDLGFSKAD